MIASSTFIVNVLHFPLSSAVVFHSWPFVPALSRSRLTQSFYRSFGLPLLLLPPSSAFHALFDSLSSPILCICPAHLILLPATFIFRCFLTSLANLESPTLYSTILNSKFPLATDYFFGRNTNGRNLLIGLKHKHRKEWYRFGKVEQ